MCNMVFGSWHVTRDAVLDMTYYWIRVALLRRSSPLCRLSVPSGARHQVGDGESGDRRLVLIFRLLLRTCTHEESQD